MQDYTGCYILRACFIPCCTDLNIGLQTLETIMWPIRSMSTNCDLFAVPFPFIPRRANIHAQFHLLEILPFTSTLRMGLSLPNCTELISSGDEADGMVTVRSWQRSPRKPALKAWK